MKKLLLIFILGFCFANQETYTVVVLQKNAQTVKYESVYFIEKTTLTVVFKNKKGKTIEIQKNRIKGIYDSDGDKIKLRDLGTSNPYLQNNNNIIKKKTSHFENNWSEESKMLFYQTEKISPEKAFLYQISVPLPFANLGYAYSDNWRKGITYDISTVCFYGLYIATIDDEDSPIPLFSAFGIIATGIYKLVDSYRLAEKYNNNLYRRLFRDKRPNFSINYSIDNGAMLSMSIPIN